MDAAYGRSDKRKVYARDLPTLETLDPKGYNCLGCISFVQPCSYHEHNIKAPYFRIIGAHQQDCEVIGPKKQVGIEPSLTESKYNKIETSPVLILELKENDKSAQSSQQELVDSGSAKPRAKRSSGVRGTLLRPKRFKYISDICNYYIKKDGCSVAKKVALPGLPERPIQEAFVRLEMFKIKEYKAGHIYFSQLWYKNQTIEDSTEAERLLAAPSYDVLLFSGRWEGRQLTKPYTLRLLWTNWDLDEKRIAFDMINDVRLKQKDGRGEGKGWLFFMGEQSVGEEANVFCVNSPNLLFSCYLQNNEARL